MEKKTQTQIENLKDFIEEELERTSAYHDEYSVGVCDGLLKVKKQIESYEQDGKSSSMGSRERSGE